MNGVKTGEELLESNWFLLTLAHDLKSPINKILLASELLENPESNTPEKFIATVKRSALQMQDMIHSLLELMKENQREKPLLKTEIAIKPFLHEIVEQLTPLSDLSQISLQIELPEEVHPLWAHPVKMSHVFHNVIGNAIKYSPPKSTVKVQLKYVDGGDALFSVIDCGPGLAQDSLNSVFEPFVSGSTTQKHGSSHGVGLAIAKEFVTNHGGSIWCESDGSSGTTFRIQIPSQHRIPDAA